MEHKVAKGSSPLYTPPATKATKAKEVKRMGPDKDGAFRYTRRVDGKN